MPILPPDTGGSGNGSDSTAIREVIFTGRSTAASQNPVVLDTPIQVEFGVAQGGVNDPLQIDAAGNITCNEDGTYYFTITLQAGRTGSAGVSFLYGRLLVDGFQPASSVLVELDDANVIIPMQFDVVVPLTVGQVVTVEIYRDSAGNNSGGIAQGVPTIGTWNNASCASLTTSRLVPAAAEIPEPAPQRSNKVLVKTKGDFPLPIGGVITLVDNTDYEINGTIDLVTDRIELTGSNNVYGLNPELDILITNNATALIRGRDAGFIGNNCTFVNIGGNIFDLEDTAGNEGTNSFFLSECVLTNSPAIGIFQDLLIVNFDKNALRNMATGASFEGTANEAMRITGNILESTTTGTVVDLGTSVFGAMSIDHNFIQASPGLVLIDGLPSSGNIALGGQGVIQSNTTFGGNLPTINNISYKDARWNWGLNNNVPDSAAIGSLYMENNTVETTFSGVSIPTKVLGTTVAGENIQRFTMPGNNTLRYVGNKFFDGTVTYSASVKRSSGSGNRLIKLTVYKNGSPLAGASQILEVTTREVPVTILANTNIQPNDEFELWISNEENTNNMQVSQLQCSIT